MPHQWKTVYYMARQLNMSPAYLLSPFADGIRVILQLNFISIKILSQFPINYVNHSEAVDGYLLRIDMRCYDLESSRACLWKQTCIAADALTVS